MESKTEEALNGLDAVEVESNRPLSFRLYEEYSGVDFQTTARSRRDRYDEADMGERRKLEAEVKEEVENFRVWLIRAKNLEDDDAACCAVSLKSALLGLPVGEQVAELFDIVMRE